jgi:RHS repeat-associated protein
MRHRNHPKGRFFRAVAAVLVPGQAFLSVPVVAAPLPVTDKQASEGESAPQKATMTVRVPEAKKPPSSPAPEPPKVKVNRTLPKVKPPTPMPEFSAVPTDLEIFQARVFEEPLVPMGGPTYPLENQALASALLTYLRGGDVEDVSPILGFLEGHAISAWRASLLTDLGIVYRRTGYFSKALKAWEEAWALARQETDPKARAMADRAVGELAELYARLGRAEALEELLRGVQGRDIRGSATERLAGARQGLWRMKTEPGESFRCGPYAIQAILNARRGTHTTDPVISATKSTTRGTSLAQMRTLAGRVGIEMQMAFRERGSPILLPALIHWKAGHFAALVREEGGRYLTQDPTFGSETWLGQGSLDDEASGYFLVPTGSLPPGWRKVDEAEGDAVWGKGAYGQGNTQRTTTCDATNGGGGAGGSGCSGGRCMATYRFHSLLASLNIRDTPVGYQPPLGPSVDFRVTYNQRDAFQPQIFTYSNLGPKWTFDWLSFVQDNPQNPGVSTTIYLRGGGAETPSGSTPDILSHAVLVLVQTSPVTYERRLPDGSKEVFAQSDGSSSFPRRVFMTSYQDAQGNAWTLTYDSQLRIVGVTDAIGQVTTLAYELPADPLKVTKVTDPFGRFARIDYDVTGHLMRTTDVIGITSQFTYGAGDFIDSLTTPYGTTIFRMWDTTPNPPGEPAPWKFARGLEATDPLGGTERLEYVTSQITGLSSGPIPAGMNVYDPYYLPYYNTFYWNKRAMALFPGDYTKAEIINWPGVVDGVLWGHINSRKRSLENRDFYSYQGQAQNGAPSSLASLKPIAVGRVLDDGTSQVYQFQYNTIGKLTKFIDPLGRETDYFYGNSNVIDPDQISGTGIDLLQIKQKNGAAYDLLESRSYNSQHEPLTVTDAAGQTTTYTYDPQGRIATITTPPRAGISENRVTTYTYYSDTAPTGAGRLHTLTAPATGATTTYEYDGYGRLSKVTDSEGYAMSTAYDALDRPTTVTYPDGTYEQTIYDRLDPAQLQDRLGRWTHIFHDALRRVSAVRDPLGRTTTFLWCSCGSLDSLLDGNGNATSWQRDAQGRVTTETRADGRQTQYVYENSTSRLLQRTDAKNQTTAYQYFPDSALKQITYTSAVIATPTVSFTYDPTYSRIATMTDGTGSTAFAYNPITTTPALGAGRLASVSGPLPNSTITYSYDELARVTTRGLSTFSTTSGYDLLGRLTSLASPPGSFTWTFLNTTGRPQTVTYPNGQVTTYSYLGNLADQRLQEIKHQQTAGGSVLSQFDYTYDAVGNIKTWQQQPSTNPAKLYSLGYDGADQLMTASVTATPLPVPSRFDYAYDSVGNRTAEQLDNGVMGATYNNRNQMTSRQPGGALLFRGTLNKAARVTVQGQPVQVAADNSFVAQLPVGAGTTNVVVAATDYSGNTRTNTYQITQSGSTITYTYDQNGNLTGDGTRTFDWDAENRLLDVKQGSTTLASFVYDGLGRRAQKIGSGITHTYVYDGANIIEERLSNGQTYDYVQGPGIDRPLAMKDQAGVVTYYLADHLGSIVQATNASGAVTFSRDYDPFGNPLAGAAMAGVAFTGREWDPETSLYYYRARYYDPRMGRFISEDPIGLGGGPNLFTYVTNSPVNYVDPKGEFLPVIIVAIIAGVIASAIVPAVVNAPGPGDPLAPTGGGKQAAATAAGAVAGGTAAAALFNSAAAAAAAAAASSAAGKAATQPFVVCSLQEGISYPGHCAYQCTNGLGFIVAFPAIPSNFPCPPVIAFPVCW